MNIPTILESLAKEIELGGSWEDAATELYFAGYTTYVDVDKTKRLVSPYLTKKN